jgi:hypothetical protein
MTCLSKGRLVVGLDMGRGLDRFITNLFGFLSDFQLLNVISFPESGLPGSMYRCGISAGVDNSARLGGICSGF